MARSSGLASRMEVAGTGMLAGAEVLGAVGAAVGGSAVAVGGSVGAVVGGTAAGAAQAVRARTMSASRRMSDESDRGQAGICVLLGAMRSNMSGYGAPPATVVMVPLVSTLRTRWLPESAM